jgi:chromate transporter
MSGLAAAAAGMTLSVGVKLGWAYLRQPVALALALLAFIGVAWLHWPLLAVLAGLAPVAIAWYRPRASSAGDDRIRG